MKIIKKLSKFIKEEIGDSEKYAECALKYKTEYPEVGKLFYTLSTEEMRHMEMLHKAVTTMIEDYRKEQGDPPEGMMALYDFLHEEQIERVAEVKILQEMYNR